MVEHLQDLSLHFGSLRLLLQCDGVFVHHLHSVQAAPFLFFFFVFPELVVAEAAEVDGADVAGADAAEEVEVAEGEGGLAADDGGVGEVGGAVRLQGQTLRRGGREEVEGETAETGAAVAFAAHGASLRTIPSLQTHLRITCTTTTTTL